MTRYDDMFTGLREQGRGALVPFVMVGDPSLDLADDILDALVAGGADALELGVPFTDPVADGPTIQDAHHRALASGAHTEAVMEALGRFRLRHPAVPVGLLVYSNMPVSQGLDEFYRRCQQVGVDSVLVADVPTREAEPFCRAAEQHGVAPVLIAPPGADEQVLADVARLCRGYVYAVSRLGVTGAGQQADTSGSAEMLGRLHAHTDLPVMLGFGISTPEHVRAALAAGADGAITGSATVAIVERHAKSWGGQPSAEQRRRLCEELTAFVAAMREGTGPVDV